MFFAMIFAALCILAVRHSIVLRKLTQRVNALEHPFVTQSSAPGLLAADADCVTKKEG